MKAGMIQKTARVLSRNSPSLLTGFAVAGLISTAILAVRATPQAMRLLDEYIQQTKEEPTVKETVMLTWKCYIPPAIMGTATIACMIGANSIHLRRNAALVSLYSLTDTALREYQAKVVDIVGKKKEDEIRGEIAQDKLEDHPIDNKSVIITGRGDTIVYDELSGRYFKSDIETIRKIQNDFNKRLIDSMYLTLNELYYELGLEPITLGGEVGWVANHDLVDMIFSAKISTDGNPCVVIAHRKMPKQLDSYNC